VRIICFGDSITQGYGLDDSQRWTGLLARSLPGHELHNYGVCGETTALALDRIVDEILPLLPAIVIVEFGLNDGARYPGRLRPRVSLAEFRDNLGEILALCRAAGGTCLLVAHHRVQETNEGHATPYVVEPYNLMIRELAQAQQVALVDIAAQVGARGEDALGLLDADGVHLSPAGNRTYATIIHAALAPLLITQPPLAMVAAMARNRVIGQAGQLPWHEPADLAHFKRTTSGHAVIMGRKTWQSLGRPLPRRRNLVVTRQADFSAPGAEIFTDLQSAIAAARRTDAEPMIIGGSEIYAQALPHATRIELTEIAVEPEGDAYFPALDGHWQAIDSRQTGSCTFRTWIRTGREPLSWLLSADSFR
jgi:dihydrofolate reductase